MNWLLIGSLAVLFLFGLFQPDWLVNIINSFCRVIPLGHAGLRTFFGQPDKKQKEGLILMIPLLHKLNVYTVESPNLIEISASIKTKKGESLLVSVMVTYKADFDLLETYHNVFGNNKENPEKIISGDIQDLLNKMGSVKNLEDFYQKLEAVSLALNCLCRLSEMPHLKRGIKIKVLDFYDRHKSKIADLVAHESEDKDDHSPIEILHGINIVGVKIVEQKFSEETEKALNQIKAQKLRRQAAAHKKALIKEFKEECGLDPANAKQAAEIALGQLNSAYAISAPGFNGLLNLSLAGEKRPEKNGKRREE